MQILEVIKVKECYHACPFFQVEEGTIMSCGHPYWKDKPVYDNVIVNQDNSRGRVPDECPLRHEGIKIIKQIQLR